MNRVSTLKAVPLSRIITLLGLISFFRPVIFEKFVATNAIFNGMLILTFVVCAIDYIQRGNKLSSRFILLAIIFYIVMMLSTIVNHESISRAIMYGLTGLFTIIFAEYVLKYQFVYATKVMRFLLWLYVVVNILTIIIFPNGIIQPGFSFTTLFFLGQPTRFSYFYLPALLFCYLGDAYEVGHIRGNTITIYFICLATLIASWTVGSSIAMLLLMAFLLFHSLIIFNNYVYYFVHLITYYGLTYLSIHYFASVYIEVFLKRDLTLSSRTFIWNKALSWISNAPYLGNGVFSNESMVITLGFVHGHNHLLQLTFQFGYIGLAIFLLMLLVSYLNLHKYKNFMPSKIIAFFIFMFSILLLVDTVDGVRNYYLFIVAIGANIRYIYVLFRDKNERYVRNVEI